MKKKKEIAEYDKKVARIFDYLREGMPEREIYAQMLIEDVDLDEARFDQMIREAVIYGENELHKDREYVFQLHMERYEKMYEETIKMTDKYGRELNRAKDWTHMVAKYSAAIAALKAKEDLIGLHDKSVSLEFNDTKVEVIEEPEFKLGSVPGVDLERLSMQECLELLGLVKESRTVPIEGVQRTIIKQTKIEITDGRLESHRETINIDHEDVTFEEMPENVVQKFTVPPKEEEDEPEEVREIIVDDRKSKEPGKDLETLKQNVNKKLLSSFKKQMKKK